MRPMTKSSAIVVITDVTATMVGPWFSFSYPGYGIGGGPGGGGLVDILAFFVSFAPYLDCCGGSHGGCLDVVMSLETSNRRGGGREGRDALLNLLARLSHLARPPLALSPLHAQNPKFSLHSRAERAIPNVTPLVGEGRHERLEATWSRIVAGAHGRPGPRSAV